jgi:hypothetical protein
MRIQKTVLRNRIGLVGTETRPIVIVHVGNKIPATAYASIRYRSSQFWIEDSDFDSKYAFTVVQDLMALAEVTDTAHAPMSRFQPTEPC